MNQPVRPALESKTYKFEITFIAGVFCGVLAAFLVSTLIAFTGLSIFFFKRDQIMIDQQPEVVYIDISYIYRAQVGNDAICVDQDHDGYAASYDCDDRDPTIHPHGNKDADGNCDGLLDLEVEPICQPKFMSPPRRGRSSLNPVESINPLP